jgi:hypothetical protein
MCSSSRLRKKNRRPGFPAGLCVFLSAVLRSRPALRTDIEVRGRRQVSVAARERSRQKKRPDRFPRPASVSGVQEATPRVNLKTSGAVAIPPRPTVTVATTSAAVIAAATRSRVRFTSARVLRRRAFAFLELVADVGHAVVGPLRNVEQAVHAGHRFDECTEVGDALDAAM